MVMKNIYWILIFVVLIRVLYKPVRKMIDKTRLKNLLIDTGFPVDTVNLFLAQAMFEAGGDLNSNVANQNHNLTGIIFLNKPYQKNAVKGLAMPKSDGKGFYANFNDYSDWAKDYKRILNLNTGKKGKPIEAKNATDLVDRLKANGYFGGSQTDYLAGVNYHLQNIV